MRIILLAAVPLFLAACTNPVGTSSSSGATDTRLPARTATILMMPQMQDGWIIAALDGTIDPATTRYSKKGDGRHYPDWDYERPRTWLVRLPDGNVFPVTQPGPPMSVGQKISVVRYGAQLALVP
jgi:hypothetical protein